MNKTDKEMEKKGFIKENGYWVSKQMKNFEPAMLMFCPKCDRALQHRDDKFMLRHRLCSDCAMEKELEEMTKDS